MEITVDGHQHQGNRSLGQFDPIHSLATDPDLKFVRIDFVTEYSSFTTSQRRKQ
jgi:hypothetical protein